MKTIRKLTYLALGLLALACFALAPMVRAVTPRPDHAGGNNTAETTGALFSLTTADGCEELSFTPPQYFPTGGSSLNVVVADFNGDGAQDFAVNNDTNVVVYFGDGRGGFGAAETLSLGGYHQGIATGDFNGDGKPDLAVTNYYEQSVSILLNDGSGGFSAPVNFSTGAIADKVAIGDFNNDDKLDLAILTGGNPVTILLGNGAGRFGGPSSYPAPKGPIDLTLADFNNDGALDVAISTYASMKVKILLGDGQGHLTGGNAYSLDGNSFAIESGDFNDDGNVDLAVSVSNIYPNDHVAIFIGDGSGAFTLAQKVYVPDATGLTTGDFNGDGKLDFAAATYGFSVVSVALGDGSGHFGAAQDVLVAHPRQSVFDVATGDFNGDGKADLVTADYGSRSRGAAVLLNLPSVKIVAADATASEPGTDTGKFRVTRTGCTDEPLLVYYTVGGTATPWRDYVALAGQVVIPEGKVGTTIDVFPLDDHTQEPPETVTVTLAADPAYHVAGQDSATITIKDND
jgi:hypothetical protein